jgi:hypothetical protein
MLNYPIKRSWTKKRAVVLAKSNFVAPASNHTGRLLIPDTRINYKEKCQFDSILHCAFFPKWRMRHGVSSFISKKSTVEHG